MRLDTTELPVASSNLTDEDLVILARTGDTWAVETLLVRYRNYARSKARSYFLVGADREDIIQEGMIGLFKAVRDFKSDRQSSFRAFAELCITRQIITAIKTATRQKHIPLNSYISLNKPVQSEETEPRSMIDILPTAEASDPLEILMNSADFASLKTCFEEILTGLEGEVLLLYLEGRSYHEIADHLECRVKTVDNALQRIKRKIEMHLVSRKEEEEDEVAAV